MALPSSSVSLGSSSRVSNSRAGGDDFVGIDKLAVVIAGKGARLLFEVSSMVVRMFCSVAGWAQSSAALGSSLLHAARRIVLKINTEAVFVHGYS